MKDSYKETKRKLDEIIEKMQDSDTDLDEALKLHEDGKKLISELENYLKEVEKKVTKATKK